MTARSRRGLLTAAGLAVAAAAGCGTAPPAPPPAAPAPRPTGAAPSSVRPGARSGAPHATAPHAAAPHAAAPQTTPSPVGRRGGAVAARHGAAMLGAYLDLDGLTQRESLALRRRQLGRDLRILHHFYAWRDELPRSAPDVPPGGVLMVTWRGARYDTITGGDSDDLVAAAARRLARYGRPTLLRWGWEMNGDWFDWGGADNDRDTAGYVAAWRRLHRIFADEGADNVSWVWGPNWNSNPDAGWNSMHHYYPGDRYVDWVGVSGYNLAEESPQRLFGAVYADYAARKPIIVAEVGAVDRGGHSKATWTTRFATWVRAHPDVGAVVWFDTDTHPGSPQRWRIDTDPAALAAFRAMARDPAFAG